MEFSPLALIGISLVAMFFGYFFGLFEGRGQGYKKRKKEEASDPSIAKAAPPAIPVTPAPAPSPTPPIAMPAPDNSLLRLSLDARQQPCLDLDGQRVDTNQIAPQQRKRLIDLMVLMRPWIDAAPMPKAQPAPMTPPAPPVAARTSGMAARLAAAAGPVKPVPAVISFAPTTPAEPVTEPASMVAQIDAILQARLIGSPLAGRGIRLIESAEGGAMVMVGLTRYAGVGEVPDAEVQAAIRAAIAEWEEKYTPG